MKRLSSLVLIIALIMSSLLCAENPESKSEEGLPKFKGDTVTTKSGLKYIDVTIGKGAVCKAGDMAEVHYTGWLTDGTKFDSSKDRNQTFQVPVDRGNVIPGWDEGLQGMTVGGKRVLIIPSELGYGSTARGLIPANATLVFEIDMVGLSELPKIPDFPDIDKLEVKKSLSGLKYAVLEEGEGEKPKMGSNVSVHYTGWLENGKMFDSSVERAQPFMFPLGMGRVIKGWDEGVAMMKPGAKYILIIPPELGYGSRNVGEGLIPPNSTLIFQVELISFSGK
jgi:peptidylprolyl isomerase